MGWRVSARQPPLSEQEDRPMDDLEYRLRKYKCEDGDVIVLETDRMLSEAAADRLQASMERVLPRARLLLLDGGTKISVLTDADIKKLLAGDNAAGGVT